MTHRFRSLAAALLVIGLPGMVALADPAVTRLTPPSNLFSRGEAEPVTARFLPGQRFDLQATVTSDPGQTIQMVQFLVNGLPVKRPVAYRTADTGPVGATIATIRAYSASATGVHQLRVIALQSDGKVASATGNFEVVRLQNGTSRARNIIFLIGDGMGIAHRTAARILAFGASQGKARGRLAMDEMPVCGMVITHSLNSIVTDSSPGSACYSTGNKSNNNQHGVFPDDTLANFDNPRVEFMGEYLAARRGSPWGS
jgi:alkaline phosphatase